MKKWIKYIILFIVSFIVINIGLKLYHVNDWKKDQLAVEKLIQHCSSHTKRSFPQHYDNSIETETKDFIHFGKDFDNDTIPYREFYKRCISDAIYNHTPQDYFNN